MRRTTIAALAAAVPLAGILATRPAVAQGVRFEARAGAAVPAGELADVVDPGFSFGVGVAIPLNARVHLRFDGDGNLLSRIDDPDFDDQVDQFFARDIGLWHYGAGLEFDLLDTRRTNLWLSLSAGGGLTTIDPEPPVTEAPGGIDVEASTRFTVNGGVTVGAILTRSFAIFVRGRAFLMFLDEDVLASNTWWNVPFQAGVRLGG